MYTAPWLSRLCLNWPVTCISHMYILFHLLLPQMQFSCTDDEGCFFLEMPWFSGNFRYYPTFGPASDKAAGYHSFFFIYFFFTFAHHIFQLIFSNRCKFVDAELRLNAHSLAVSVEAVHLDNTPIKAKHACLESSALVMFLHLFT